MSFFEILVVLMVALLVTKPEDIPKITAKIRELRKFIHHSKQEFLGYLDPGFSIEETQNKNLERNIEQMNFYLQKISDLGSEYEGEYSLEAVKEHYRIVMNKKINAAINQKKNND
jgi:Sec-independent protein translocase protein TatA